MALRSSSRFPIASSRVTKPLAVRGGTLMNSRVGGGLGGGIMNLLGGTLNVAGCTITGNEAVGGASASGNGAPALGGGIDNNNQCR
jgi:hypothetical protein